jgi:hypothetical protein
MSELQDKFVQNFINVHLLKAGLVEMNNELNFKYKNKILGV